MQNYRLPCGWEISFSDEWIGEYSKEDGQCIFYPPNSDLTIRITPFHIEKENTPAPAEVMEAAYINSILESAKPRDMYEYILEGFSIQAYEEETYENGKIVYAIKIGYYAPGDLLSVNIFSTNKTECEQSLKILKTIRRVSS